MNDLTSQLDSIIELRRRLYRALEGPVEECRPRGGVFAPPLDIVGRLGEVVISVELPGVSREDVNVELKGSVLTISGERRGLPRGGRAPAPAPRTAAGAVRALPGPRRRARAATVGQPQGRRAHGARGPGGRGGGGGRRMGEYYWNPRREIRELRARVEQAFRQAAAHERTCRPAGGLIPPIDVSVGPEGVRVVMDLPGVRREDLSVTVERGALIICGCKPLGSKPLGWKPLGSKAAGPRAARRGTGQRGAGQRVAAGARVRQLRADDRTPRRSGPGERHGPVAGRGTAGDGGTSGGGPAAAGGDRGRVATRGRSGGRRDGPGSRWSVGVVVLSEFSHRIGPWPTSRISTRYSASAGTPRTKR